MIKQKNYLKQRVLLNMDLPFTKLVDKSKKMYKDRYSFHNSHIDSYNTLMYFLVQTNKTNDDIKNKKFLMECFPIFMAYLFSYGSSFTSMPNIDVRKLSIKEIRNIKKYYLEVMLGYYKEDNV